jgi:hypothetical protein
MERLFPVVHPYGDLVDVFFGAGGMSTTRLGQGGQG